MGSVFPPDCHVSLPLPAQEYFQLYFATDGNSTFRDLVCEARLRPQRKCLAAECLALCPIWAVPAHPW